MPSRQEDQATLITAVERGEADRVRQLLQAGVDADSRDAHGQPALQIAAGAGNLQLVKILLEAGADVNAQNWHLSTYSSSDQGEAEAEGPTAKIDLPQIMEQLPEALAEQSETAEQKPAIPDAPGDDPLSAAVGNGHLEVARQLIEAGAKVNLARKQRYERWPPLSLAARRNDTAVIKLLLEHGAKLEEGQVNFDSNQNCPPLVEAALAGAVEAGRLLIARGAKVVPKQRYANPFGSAVVGGSIDFVKLLLESGADPTAFSDSALINGVIERGDVPMFDFLLPYMPPRSREKYQKELRRQLDKLQRVPSATQKQLDKAISTNRVERVRQALAAGADPNYLNEFGSQPLDGALHHDPEIVRVLLEAGANPNPVDEEGDPQSLLHEVVDMPPRVRNSAAVLRLLLKAGAAVEALDEERRSPLMLAALMGKPDLCRILLEFGASTILSSAEGKTAADYAAEADLTNQERQELVNLLGGG